MTQTAFQRIKQARTDVLVKYPFFGNLLIRLRLGLADCKTAYTDMKNIVFDPAFVEVLNDEQLQFIMMHEVMHCVLKHCVRGREYQPLLFNIACDIVVNDNILKAMMRDSFEIAGEEVMHLAPDGKDGSEYNAEEVYHMLLSKTEEELEELYGVFALFGEKMDSHEEWDQIAQSPFLDDEWEEKMNEAAKMAGGDYGIPPSVRKILKEREYESQLDWRQLLNQFLEYECAMYDYSYRRPDRRFSDQEFILPSFLEMESPVLRKLWFLMDTSASVTDETLSTLYAETVQAVMQHQGLKGFLSFFDTSVSEPKEFSTLDDLRKMDPIGGGGTSFHAIFRYMERKMKDNLPCAVIIFTDGYATFPEEEATLGIPVLWIIVDSDVTPPWGQIARIKTK